MERKIALFSLACASIFACGAAFADDFVINTGNVTTDLPSSYNGKDVDVYYTGTAGVRARFGSSGPRVHSPLSLTFKDGGQVVPGSSDTSTIPDHWNILGNFTFDINTATGTKTVIKDETESARINYQLGTIVVKNTAANIDGASAKIDLGASTLIFNGNGNAQTPTLDVQTDTLVTTTSTTTNALYFYRSCAVNVSNASTLTLNNSTKFGATDTVVDPEWDKRPKINLTGDSTLVFVKDATFYNTIATGDASSSITFSDTTKFYEGTAMTLAGTVNQSGAVTMSDDSSLTVGTLNQNAAFAMNNSSTLIAGTINSKHNLSVNAGATLTVDTITTAVGKIFTVRGSATVGGGNLAQTAVRGGTLTLTNTDGTTLQRYVIVTDGGTLQTDGHLTIKGGTNPGAANWAAMTIDAGSHVYIDASNPRVVMENGEIIFNQENAITKTSGALVKLINKNNTVKAILTINASQTFSNSFANTKNFDIYLSTENDSTFTSGFQVDDDFLGKFIIHDFDEDRVCVTQMRNYSGDTIDDPNLVFTAFRTVGTEEQQIETLYVVDGWLSAIAPVPEPSTWAAILGAVALAFAIRRRK